MNKNIVVLFLILMVLTLAGCGKNSGVEGKLVDGKGKPLSGVKLIAKQVEPIKGYERFETKTGSDGTFRFDKLYPFSGYILIPTSGSWKTNERKKIQTTGDEKTIKLSLAVRFTRANGVVTDTKTGLMWAAHDNGKKINWPNAEAYCQTYKGGGFNDWRLPTKGELVALYKAGIRDHRDNQIIGLSACCPWASKTRGSKAVHFHFDAGDLCWGGQSCTDGTRALPVRGDKGTNLSLLLKTFTGPISTAIRINGGKERFLSLSCVLKKNRLN